MMQHSIVDDEGPFPEFSIPFCYNAWPNIGTHDSGSASFEIISNEIV